jgi:hypothetical protein
VSSSKSTVERIPNWKPKEVKLLAKEKKAKMPKAKMPEKERTLARAKMLAKERERLEERVKARVRPLLLDLGRVRSQERPSLDLPELVYNFPLVV